MVRLCGLGAGESPRSLVPKNGVRDTFGGRGTLAQNRKAPACGVRPPPLALGVLKGARSRLCRVPVASDPGPGIVAMPTVWYTGP